MFILFAGIVVLGAALFALTIKLARVVVMPKPFKNVRVYRASEDRIVLEANPRTTHVGSFGLAFDSGAGHAVIGEIVSINRRRKTVERELLSATGEPLVPTRFSHWEGNVFAGPANIDPNYQEVAIPVGGGVAPAWLIPAVPEAMGGEDTWAIHVHGIRTTRINALRTVPAARSLGFTSLVVSYRGDGEGPATPHGASMLGLTEWRDIDSAIAYARDHGARSIVLFGWSMGASAVLLTAERSTHADMIVGTVLVSPAIDWRGTLRHVARSTGLPTFCADLAMAALADPRLSRVVGVPEPIDFDMLDWTSGPRMMTPCLIIHSPGDEKIPVELSREAVAANPDYAEVFESSDAMHAWEYNVEPAEFDRAITSWVRAHHTGEPLSDTLPI